MNKNRTRVLAFLRCMRSLMMDLDHFTVDYVKASGSFACVITVFLGALLELLVVSDNELRKLFR